MNSYEVSNPVFNTAKMTLYWLSRSGNEIAETYLEKTGFDESFGREKIPFFDALALPNTVGQELRYLAVNRLVRESGAKNILDLACGFSPRGLDMSREGYNYRGGDLQMVVPVIQPIVKELAGDRAERVNYSIVDVTDRTSVMAAADTLEGPVAVITEGLMVYLNDYEKKTVCENMAAVLKKHGGCYITPDFNSNVYALDVSRVLVDKMAMTAVMNTMKQFEKAGDSDVNENMKKSPEEMVTLFNEAGLDVKILPLYTEDMDLRTFGMVEPQRLDELKTVLAKGNIWYCTLREDAAGGEKVSSSGKFSVSSKVEKGALRFALTGRLDSLTAPAFYDSYVSVHGVESIMRIDIDMTKLEYISSAGLRVLLTMKNKLPGREICVRGCSEAVKEVLLQTGFDNVLTIE